MIVTATFRKSWPKCAHYVEEFLSDEKKFKEKHFSVYSAFHKTCTIQLSAQEAARSRALITEVFTLGDGPEIKVNRLLPTQCALFDPFNGLRYATRDIIQLGEEAADTYENGHGWMVLEGALLHESVHWVRFNCAPPGDANTLSYQSIEDPNDAAGTALEVGNWFWTMAYGFNPCTRGTDGKLIQFGPDDTLPIKKPRGAGAAKS